MYTLYIVNKTVLAKRLSPGVFLPCESNFDIVHIYNLKSSSDKTPFTLFTHKFVPRKSEEGILEDVRRCPRGHTLESKAG